MLQWLYDSQMNSALPLMFSIGTEPQNARVVRVVAVVAHHEHVTGGHYVVRAAARSTGACSGLESRRAAPSFWFGRVPWRRGPRVRAARSATCDASSGSPCVAVGVCLPCASRLLAHRAGRGSWNVSYALAVDGLAVATALRALVHPLRSRCLDRSPGTGTVSARRAAIGTALPLTYTTLQRTSTVSPAIATTRLM